MHSTLLFCSFTHSFFNFPILLSIHPAILHTNNCAISKRYKNEHDIILVLKSSQLSGGKTQINKIFSPISFLFLFFLILFNLTSYSPISAQHSKSDTKEGIFYVQGSLSEFRSSAQTPCLCNQVLPLCNSTSSGLLGSPFHLTLTLSS